MTVLEYLDDSYKKESSTKLVKVCKSVWSEYEVDVILGTTIFYPQGGGQPADRGVIRFSEGVNFEVQKVTLDQAGIVHHLGKFAVCGEGVDFKVGGEVNLEIDWEWRLENMKLHTAGHLVADCVRNYFPELGLRPIKGFHFPEGPCVEFEGRIDDVDLRAKLKGDLANIVNKKIVEGGVVQAWEVGEDEARIMGIASAGGQEGEISSIGWI